MRHLPRYLTPLLRRSPRTFSGSLRRVALSLALRGTAGVSARCGAGVQPARTPGWRWVCRSVSSMACWHLAADLNSADLEFTTSLHFRNVRDMVPAIRPALPAPRLVAPGGPRRRPAGGTPASGAVSSTHGSQRRDRLEVSRRLRGREAQSRVGRLGPARCWPHPPPGEDARCAAHVCGTRWSMSHLLTSPGGDARSRPAGGGRSRLGGGLSEAGHGTAPARAPAAPAWQGALPSPAQPPCHPVGSVSLSYVTIIVTASARGLRSVGHPGGGALS